MALASIVHLSSWSVCLPTDDNSELLKSQIKMSIGGLKAMGEIWPSAAQVLGQVTKVSHEIFKMQVSNMNAAFWTPLADEELFATLVDAGSQDDEFQFLQQY